MTPKKLTNFRIDGELIDGLESIRERDPDWSVSRQVREAIKDWLAKNDVIVKSAPRPRRKRGRRA
jgi:hypothetical protein